MSLPRRIGRLRTAWLAFSGVHDRRSHGAVLGAGRRGRGGPDAALMRAGQATGAAGAVDCFTLGSQAGGDDDHAAGAPAPRRAPSFRARQGGPAGGTDEPFPTVEKVRDGLWSIPVPLPNNSLRYVLVYVFETDRGPT